jgi:hypothetical protein
MGIKSVELIDLADDGVLWWTFGFHKKLELAEQLNSLPLFRQTLCHVLLIVADDDPLIF